MSPEGALEATWGRRERKGNLGTTSERDYGELHTNHLLSSHPLAVLWLYPSVLKPRDRWMLLPLSKHVIASLDPVSTSLHQQSRKGQSCRQPPRSKSLSERWENLCIVSQHYLSIAYPTVLQIRDLLHVNLDTQDVCRTRLKQMVVVRICPGLRS